MAMRARRLPMPSRFRRGHLGENSGSKDQAYCKRMLSNAMRFLRIYECPHGPICVFFREDRLDLCPFGHGHVDDPNLKPLPNYVCVPYLLNACIKLYLPPEMFSDRSVCVECRNIQNEQCEFGLHLRPSKLPGFEESETNLNRIAMYREIYPNDEYMCIVCRENIRLDRRAPELQEFCILAGCNHVHCAQCMRFDRLLRARCGFRCPGAEKAIFVHFCSKIENTEEKQAMFANVPRLVLGHQNMHRSIVEVMQPIDDIERIYEFYGLGEVPRNPKDFHRSMLANLNNDALRQLMQTRFNSRQRFDWNDLLRHFDDANNMRFLNDSIYNIPLDVSLNAQNQSNFNLSL